MGAIMHPGDIPVQVYKPLSNKYLDEMFKHIRARFGGYNVAKHSTAREVIKLRREGRRIAIGLITDQSPNRSEAHYWTTFLNQDTVFMDGAERIAKLMDFPSFIVNWNGHPGILQSALRFGYRNSQADGGWRDNRVLRPSSGADHPARTGLLVLVS